MREIGDLGIVASTVAFRRFTFAGQVTTTPDSTHNRAFVGGQTSWDAAFGPVERDPERGGGRPLARCWPRVLSHLTRLSLPRIPYINGFLGLEATLPVAPRAQQPSQIC